MATPKSKISNPKSEILNLKSTIFLLFLLLLAHSALAQEYTVRPGDTINVTVWERDSLSGIAVVDANGYVALPPPIGSLKVTGLTASEISALLTERLKEYIKTPTVFVSIKASVGFTVHVLGEVRAPDFIIVPEGTRLQEAITRAGGLTQLADPKRIRLIRKEKDADQSKTSETVIDFSRFVEESHLPANPVLKPDDVIIIPRLPRSERSARTVNVIGAVASPGIFSLEESTPLIEVLALAGGVSDAADLQNVSILTLSQGQYSWRKVNFQDFLAGGESADSIHVAPGETVFIPRIVTEKEETFTVNVIGQTLKPGAYPVAEGVRLFDAIFMAGGPAEDADIDRITIIHRKPRSPIKTQVNIREYLLTGDEKYNPQLVEGDIIFIPVSADAKKRSSINIAPSIRVSIIGQVSKPDTYHVSPEVSVLDVLKLAGGPTIEADLKRVTVIREQEGPEQRLKIDMEKVLTEGKFNLMPPLQKDDTIFVPKIKPKREIWRTIVRTAADISTILVAYYLITRGRKIF